jgi:hypothetical protein
MAVADGQSVASLFFVECKHPRQRAAHPGRIVLFYSAADWGVDNTVSPDLLNQVDTGTVTRSLIYRFN